MTNKNFNKTDADEQIIQQEQRVNAVLNEIAEDSRKRDREVLDILNEIAADEKEREKGIGKQIVKERRKPE